MPKKNKRGKGRRSQKWSRANMMNFVLGGIVAVSMLLGSLFVFGGAQPSSSNPTVTPIPVVVQTAVPPAVQAAPTVAPTVAPTTVPSTAPAAPTVAAPTVPPAAPSATPTP